MSSGREYVPFVAVRRSGGAAATKQFENVAPPPTRSSNSPLRSTCAYSSSDVCSQLSSGKSRRRAGKATKEAAEADRPALIGRLLTSKERQELRYGAHSRKAYGGVLTCDEGWRLYGLSAAPPEPMSQAKGGQSKIATFFGAGAAKAKEAKELQMVKEPQEAEETRPPEVQEAQEADAAEAGAARTARNPGAQTPSTRRRPPTMTWPSGKRRLQGSHVCAEQSASGAAMLRVVPRMESHRSYCTTTPPPWQMQCAYLTRRGASGHAATASRHRRRSCERPVVLRGSITVQ